MRNLTSKYAYFRAKRLDMRDAMRNPFISQKWLGIEKKYLLSEIILLFDIDDYSSMMLVYLPNNQWESVWHLHGMYWLLYRYKLTAVTYELLIMTCIVAELWCCLCASLVIKMGLSVGLYPDSRFLFDHWKNMSKWLKRACWLPTIIESSYLLGTFVAIRAISFHPISWMEKL